MKIQEILSLSERFKIKIPILGTSIPAGFPSPAEDYIEKSLDLNELIIKKPAATYFVKVSGNSMKNAFINSGDILVIDRSITPVSGKIVIAVINGEMTVKRFLNKKGLCSLVPENDDYPEIKITDDNGFEIWGVVSYIIHKAE